MREELTPEQYAKADGNQCPICGGDVEGGSVEVSDHGAHQEVNCLECEATWTDTYVLTGYTDLTFGTKRWQNGVLVDAGN